MVREEAESVCFPEPTPPDPSPGRRGEPAASWLARSTHRNAVLARGFLNESLAALPEDCRTALLPALREDVSGRWHTAFFELHVARCLQTLGAAVAVGDATPTGKHPDYVARFPDVSVVVEATVPVIHGHAGRTLGRRIPLLDIVEAAVPDGWAVRVWRLPDLGPDDSRREFRDTVRDLLAGAPPAAVGVAPITLCAELSTGDVELCLTPRRPGAPVISLEPPVTSWDDTAERVRRAVHRKKAQARGAGAPVLLAIKAFDLTSSLEGFDVALFGHTVARFDAQRQPAGSRFHRDGVFLSDRSEPPVFAGALVFTAAGFRPGPAPVLYRHPRFRGRLPWAVRSLGVKWFDERAERVRVRAPRRSATPRPSPGQR
jgi:hypothetical protein